MKLLLIILFCFLSFFKVNSSDDINDIKSLLEGRYELVYWEQDNLKFNYPQIAGTLVVNNGKISFTLDSNMNNK